MKAGKRVICPSCKRLLLLAETGRIEIKCPRCKTITRFEIGEESVKHTVIRE